MAGTNSRCSFYRGVRLVEVSVKRESTVKKKLDTTKPPYREPNLPVPWPFVISRFHCSTH